MPRNFSFHKNMDWLSRKCECSALLSSHEYGLAGAEGSGA